MIIDLPILESIKDLQTQHGLNYENYQRYRSYCSRRLHRLRKSLNVHQGIASSAKARHQRGRKLMDISNAMVLEAGEKDQEYAERILSIPLCLAERAWSYAMQLKQETSDHPRRKYHLIRRLYKASEHAERFEKLCHDPESPCSDRTKKEATAYAAYIVGLYNVERGNWAEAKEKLRSSLTIYMGLSTNVRKDRVIEHYRQRIDELRASLRYCAFNLGEQDSQQKFKVKLPSELQFHDLAFKHAEQLQTELAAKKAVEKTKKVVKMDTSPIVAPTATATAAASTVEDEDDEFEETQEGLAEEESDVESEEESEYDDDEGKDQPASRVGGVTGLVKNWLGGWS